MVGPQFAMRRYQDFVQATLWPGQKAENADRYIEVKISYRYMTGYRGQLSGMSVLKKVFFSVKL